MKTDILKEIEIFMSKQIKGYFGLYCESSLVDGLGTVVAIKSNNYYSSKKEEYLCHFVKKEEKLYYVYFFSQSPVSCHHYIEKKVNICLHEMKDVFEENNITIEILNRW